MNDPICEFRIRTRHGRGTVVVRVWPTLRALRARYVRLNGRTSDRPYGFCQGFARPSGKRAREFAEIGLAENWLHPGIIAHEVAHAALWWNEWKGRHAAQLGSDGTGRSTEYEEDFCYVTGELVQGITTALVRAGYRMG